MKRLAGLILVSIVWTGALSSQVVPPSGTAVEYDATEFPAWAVEVRRAEIIAAGAFPVMFLFSQLGFDYVYYLTNSFPTANIPWPVGPGTSGWTQTTNSKGLATKNLTLLISSASLSLAIAAADWAIGKWVIVP